MKHTAQVKLLPSLEQAKALRKTLEVANTACNYMSHQAWEHKTFRQFSLHKRTYRDVRDRLALSAQVVVRCIAKVGDAYKFDRKTKRTFKRHGAIAFDDRILSWHLARKEVSIWTVEGRQRIPFSAGERQLQLLRGQRGEVDLCYVKGKFYLFAACDVEAPKPMDVEGALGVDLGIVNLAADSDGENFSGAEVDRNRRILNIAERICKRNKPRPPNANSRNSLESRRTFKKTRITELANCLFKRRKTLAGRSLWKI